MNGNDIADILASVRHWLVNGKDGDLSDMNTPDDQLQRIIKLHVFLSLNLRQELLSYQWKR